MKQILTMLAAAAGSAIVVSAVSAQPELVQPTPTGPPGYSKVNPTPQGGGIPGYPMQGFPIQGYPDAGQMRSGGGYPMAGYPGGGYSMGAAPGAMYPGGGYPGMGNAPPGYGGGGPMMGGPGMAPGPVPPGGAPPDVAAEKRKYGLNPWLAKFMDDHGCLGCKKKKKDHPLPPKPPPMPVANGGTLVYPNHPFVHGPRDYFMYGERGAPWGE